MVPRGGCILLLLLRLTTTTGWLTQQQLTRMAKSNFLQSKSQIEKVSTSTALSASKFSQPAFSQPAFAGNGTSKQQGRKKKPVVRKFGADSKIASLHSERVKTAGRVGTKRYVDPCKVFLGNLPFNVTEQVLEQWVSDRLGIPAPLLMKQVKVIRDWKTGKSKGYGFVVFTEAIHGTVCIEKCNGQSLYGRSLSVNQGKKKETTQIIVKKKKQPPVDAEEAAIQAGLEEASRMDPQEALMLRQLDPDLVDDDFETDEGLFDDDDVDDDGVDGFFVEDDEEDFLEEDTPMNRQKRRELARKKKRSKPSNKGFG